MNYLELCQTLCVECGISGTFGSVTGVTGEFARVANWIRQSWNEIQNKADDWGFMRSSYLNGGLGTTFEAGSAVKTYPLGTTPLVTCMVDPDDFGKWDPYSFRSYTTSLTQREDEIFLDLVTFDDWRDAYMYGAMRQTVTRPVAVAIAPDNSVCLGPPSNGLYSVEADYWRSPQILTADGDIPLGLPVQYHMMIVYAAMKKYAGYEAAPEVAIRGEDEFKPIFNQVLAKFGPNLVEGPTLA